MLKFKLRTKSGIVVVMLLGAFFSLSVAGGPRPARRQAKEASTSRDERLAEASEARIKELRSRLQITAAQEFCGTTSLKSCGTTQRPFAPTFPIDRPGRIRAPRSTISKLFKSSPTSMPMD